MTRKFVLQQGVRDWDFKFRLRKKQNRFLSIDNFRKTSGLFSQFYLANLLISTTDRICIVQPLCLRRSHFLSPLLDRSLTRLNTMFRQLVAQRKTATSQISRFLLSVWFLVEKVSHRSASCDHNRQIHLIPPEMRSKWSVSRDLATSLSSNKTLTATPTVRM